MYITGFKTNSLKPLHIIVTYIVSHIINGYILTKRDGGELYHFKTLIKTGGVMSLPMQLFVYDLHFITSDEETFL